MLRTKCYSNQFFHFRGTLSINLINLKNQQIKQDSCDRGTVFGLFAVAVIGIAFGAIVQLVKLPPLFGMLIAGVILCNLPAPFAVAIFINPHVASALRKAAFTVVLLQGGLALDLKALRQLKVCLSCQYIQPDFQGPCLRLASIPCLVECLSAMVTVHLIFGYSLIDGLLVGTILGAVSPAIVVPFMVQLDEQRMGVKKGMVRGLHSTYFRHSDANFGICKSQRCDCDCGVCTGICNQFFPCAFLGYCRLR